MPQSTQLTPAENEIALFAAMAAKIPHWEWDIRLAYHPGHTLSAEIFSGDLIVSGKTPDGPLEFDLTQGLDLNQARARFERELAAVRIDSDLFE